MGNSLENWLQIDRTAAKRLLEQITREKAERSLPEFIRQAWPVIEPGTKYVDNWHIDLIGEYMEAVNAGQIRRLVINIPPRHMKSLEVAVCYPVWTWIRHPEKRFIKVIYSQNFHRDLGCAEDEWRVKGFTADDMGILLGVYSTESAAVSAFENLMTAAADGSVAYVMPADEEAAIC